MSDITETITNVFILMLIVGFFIGVFYAINLDTNKKSNERMDLCIKVGNAKDLQYLYHDREFLSEYAKYMIICHYMDSKGNLMEIVI